MSERVVVTGASGHIGYHVAAALLDQGYDCHLLLRRRNALTDRLELRGANVHLADFSGPGSWPVLSGASGLFHLAASNTLSQSAGGEVLESTLGLTERLIQAALDAGVPRIVYTSSAVVLGRSRDPARLINEDDLTTSAESPYVRGKSGAEQFCRARMAAGADIRILYPSWVVGPDDPKCTPPHRLILNYLTKGQAFAFGGGISIAHVCEVAAAHVAAFTKGQPQGRYVLGGENVTFRDFYGLLARLTGRRPPVLMLSKAVMMALATGARAIFGLLGKEPPVSPSYVDAVVDRFSWYDSGKAIRDLGYRIRPIEESLAEAVLNARRRLAGVYPLNLKVAGKAPPALADPAKDVLLITGAPGWLSNRMIDTLINGDRFGQTYPPRTVRLLVHPSSRGLLELPANFEIHSADINDKEAVKKSLAGVRSVFHLAGAIYTPRIATLYQVNAEGTKNLVDACIESGVRRIIYMSTDSVCGHGTPGKRIFDENTPPSPYKNYGRSKWLGEDYLLRKTREGLIDGTSLRGFWFFGPYAPARQLDFARMFFWPRQIVFGNGRNLRSISHVDNIIQAFFRAEKNPVTHGKWYWIGDPDEGYLVDAIYQHIAEAMGRPYKPFHIPPLLCRCFGLADDFLGLFGRLHPTIHAAGKFYFDIAGSSAAAMRDFGYEPRVGLDDAAQEMKSALADNSS
jgi:dihydroflavonol-4-reductase